MKKRIYAFVINLTILISILLNLSGCEKISQGTQRLKFEFLYKMNNYATLFREYTGSINYYSDLDPYIERMNKLYGDVNNMVDIGGYGTSRTLKESFLTAIDMNINSAKALKQKSEDSTSTVSIRKDYEVIIMDERIDKFIDELNEAIVEVGKE